MMMPWERFTRGPLRQMMFMDSCDHYDTQQEMLVKWNAGIPSVTPTTAGRNGRGVDFNGGALEKSLTHQSGWVVGWALNLGALTGGFPNSAYYIGSHAGETGLFSVFGETDGSLSIYAGNGRHNLIQNSAGGGFFLHSGIWYWIDLKYSITGTSNMNITATLRVNTQVWCTGSAATDINVLSLLLQTATTNYHHIAAGGGLGNADDFGIAAINGTGLINDFWGDWALSALFPNADVQTDWNQSAAGSAFILVNEQFPDGDATYIFSDTVGNIENFGWQPTAVPAGGSIVAVHYGVYARKDAEGARAFWQQSGPSGAPNWNSVDWYVGDTYAYYFSCLDADPATGAAWTQAGFNSTDFGVKLTA